MNCRRCNRPCDGSMMRTNTRYTRVATMLREECPVDAEGRLEVCHRCQRDAYFANGFIALLIADIQWFAKYPQQRAA